MQIYFGNKGQVSCVRIKSSFLKGIQLLRIPRNIFHLTILPCPCNRGNVERRKCIIIITIDIIEQLLFNK